MAVLGRDIMFCFLLGYS